MSTQKQDKKSQIEEAIRKGKKLQIPGGFIAFKESPLTGSLHDNYAISVSKKYHKSAVKRNSIRRKIRPLIEKLLASPQKSVFVVVVIKSPIEESNLKVAINDISERIGSIYN